MIWGMRVKTSVTIEESVLRAIDKTTSRTRSRSRVIEDAARQFLARTVTRDGRPKAPAFRVITFKGRLRPGVDLDDSAALLDLMEGTAAPRRR